ncbi:putative adhesion G protein-coupled receptor E4P [Oratosquilla oratoria]|uniref:putative adhesion G protein-coupled receptor E4P n=1 Tax=Oratosquilla oratoria TaxID=337810 RepID=UPI003F76B753
MSWPTSGTATLVLLACILQVVQPVDVDGGWSPWATLHTPCSRTCGGGEQLRFRSCSMPTPRENGQKCLMSDLINYGDEETSKAPCNTQDCEKKFAAWSNCSAICDKGTQTRVQVCGDSLDICNPHYEEEMECNTWNKSTCISPCDDEDNPVTCPEFAVCRDTSTEKERKWKCECTMGFKMNAAGLACIRPPPELPTPRPIPTLPPEQKVVATVISKTASTVIIIFVSITLCLFLFLRIFTPDRVIQMNMEIALLMAHIFLVFPVETVEYPTLCRIVSICVHLCFTACFFFIFLEALHMYSFVAYIIKKDGMLTRMQYVLVGWGCSCIIILFCMCFEYENYGGEYHCWLQMDKPLFYGQMIPVITLVILTFTLIEAAGAAEYKPLKGMDQKQLTSARISQRTNLIILPFVFSHWLVGMFSEYEQNMALYGTFSILNGITGGVVFFFHCSNNQQVRAKLVGLYKKMCKGSSAS